jgi:hypothetical protein
MDDFIADDEDPIPPTPQRVAARSMVLAAVACRGAIEKGNGDPDAEEIHRKIMPWLESIGAAGELEPRESSLITTPLGLLDQKAQINASWQAEGMAVLAWALHCAPLPPVHAKCDPAGTANAMGFLGDMKDTPMYGPMLRDEDEIGKWADTYMTLHWRLRLIDSNPGPMDYVACIEKATWYPHRLDQLDLVDNDVAINGVRVDRLDYNTYRQTLSITQERHQAFNWLLGFENLYSQVTTDT